MSIAAVEADIIATMRADLGATVRQVMAVPGDWDEDLLKQMLALAPFIMVAFSGGAALAPGATTAQINSQWEVYVGTAHASGQAARRLGDAQQIGAYQLLERVVARLHGHTVPNVGTLALQRVANFFSGTVERQGLAVYGAVFDMPMQFDLAAAADLGNFATFAVQYDLPPLGTTAAHQAWLAGNYATSAPDARDTLTLPTP